MIGGNTATVKVPAGSSSGAEIACAARSENLEGGDLIARLSIQSSREAQPRTQKLVKTWRKAEGDLDVRASLAKAAEE